MMTPEGFVRLRMLHDQDHLGINQIARILGLNVKTVGKWVGRTS